MLFSNVKINILQHPVIKVTALFTAMYLSNGFHILVTFEPYMGEKVLNVSEKCRTYQEAQSPSLRSHKS